MKKIIFIFFFILLLVSCENTTKETIIQKETTDDKKEVVKKKMTYPKNEPYEILSNMIIQGEKYAIANSPYELESYYYSKPLKWILKENITNFPIFKAPNFIIIETLYNMALEESILNIRDDKTFMAGKSWTGVWTRDISYSIELALGLIHPEISKNSLKAKVNINNTIVQDTGTGGSWPVSSDRVVWSIAAWEVYLITQDTNFLEWAYNIMKNSAEQDLKVLYDKNFELFKGESSFMDWREQTYPIWMTPTDIYESFSLSTCALHFQFYKILSDAANILKKGKEEIIFWKNIAMRIQGGINNHFWNNEKNYFSSYKYPSIMGNINSDKSDNLGECLAIIFKIPNEEKSKLLMENIPVVHFGVPCIYPQQPHATPYHNKGIWPFVVSYYMRAANIAGNLNALEFAFKSIIRAAGFFATHKENFVYDNGHSVGTAVNSDRQLWSVAGYLSSIYKNLFGINIQKDGIYFNPAIPNFIQGPLFLENFKINNLILNIKIFNNGNIIEKFLINGNNLTPPYKIDFNTSGIYNIEIYLKNPEEYGKINIVDTKAISPSEISDLKYEIINNNNIKLTWNTVKDADRYLIFKNGKLINETKETNFIDSIDNNNTIIYSIQTVSKENIKGNFSRYLIITNNENTIKEEIENGEYLTNLFSSKNKGFSGTGFVKTPSNNEEIKLKLNINKKGNYLIRIKYSNGSGPINTDNKCAIRSLKINDKYVGTLIFPQTGNWNNWNYSSSLIVNLNQGENTFIIYKEKLDDNMNLKVNYAYLDFFELIEIKN